MNREILFKAKTEMIVRSYNNGLDDGIWVKGYLRCDCGMWLIYQFEYDRADQVAYEVNPETICQYTGLKDKNGNKIWENDIVNYLDTYSTESGYAEASCIGKVVWDNETLSFLVTNRMSAESYEVLDECAVIGNIFDNPEILEGGAEK